MEYRQLGRTGVRVSQLCLGTMSFGAWSDENTSIAVVDRAIDAGINFIDTADCYGEGVSEQILGKALKKNGKRDNIVLATKAVASMGPGPNDRGASRFHLSRAVEDSLKRLQTDRIDLFYLHVVDIRTPMDEIFSQLDILVKQGKILYVGTSKWPVPLIMEGLMMHEKYGYPRIVAEQPPYHLCDRGIENELVWTCMRHGIGLCTWGPLASGILSGVYRKDQSFPEGHRKSGSDPETDKRLTTAALDVIEKLIVLAEARGIALPDLCHAWLLQRPGITAPIIGASKLEYVDAAVRATEIELTAEELAEIDRIIPPGSAVSDYYDGNTYARMRRAVNSDQPFSY